MLIMPYDANWIYSTASKRATGKEMKRIKCSEETTKPKDLDGYGSLLNFCVKKEEGGATGIRFLKDRVNRMDRIPQPSKYKDGCAPGQD